MSDSATGWTSEFDTIVDPATEWTAANIQEALPGLITPMTWTLSRPLLEYAFTRPAQRIGAAFVSRDPYVAMFYGRCFLNLSALREGATRVPLTSPEAIDEHYLGKARDRSVPPWKPGLGQQLTRLAVLPRIGIVQLTAGSQIESIEAEVEALRVLDLQRPLDAMAARELVATLDDGRPLGREVASLHIGTSGGASTTFGLLGRLTREWLGDQDGSLQATLCTGLSGVESAQPPRAIWRLARLSLQSREATQALAAPDPAGALTGLRASSEPAAREFVAAYDAFIERFGHRSVMEAELSARAWAEDPRTVFAMVRNMAAAGHDADPSVAEERQRQAREEATAAACRRLSRPRRLVFRKVLDIAQHYVATRERTKSLLVKGSHRTRLLLRSLGRRLQESGVIEREDDVFYLTWDEARAIALGHEGPQAGASVHRRRAEEERNRAVLLPESFFGRPSPVSAALAGRAETLLKGIPVSPGRVTGIARVIMDPRETAEIAAGEILVAPVTDAGWTPLFLTAAAVVVDIGGPLSHGATVARELGLPAVVNVKRGTSLIRSGQRITVDGAAGTVTLEE